MTAMLTEQQARDWHEELMQQVRLEVSSLPGGWLQLAAAIESIHGRDDPGVAALRRCASDLQRTCRSFGWPSLQTGIEEGK